MPTPTPENENATASRTDKAVVCDASGSAFRWAYAAVCALAVKLLAEDNRTCGDNWPAGQSWDDLGGSSKSIYLHRARELAGIPHVDFLAVVRADSDAVEDIYEAGRLPQNVPSEPRGEAAHQAGRSPSRVGL